MPVAKKKTPKARVKIKDLKARKNPKGGTTSLDASSKYQLDAASKIRNLDASAYKIR